jgi:hypothetical protein
MTEGAPAAFFSYCREDSDFALRLAEDLKAAGANVWLDQLDIVPGERWDSAVEEALANCPRMLVILSPASVNSINVMDEVSFALEEKKTVIPVIYKDCTVPFRLRRVQYVDLKQDYVRGLKELLKTLDRLQKAIPSLQTSSEIPSQCQINVTEANEHERPAEEESRQTQKSDDNAWNSKPSEATREWIPIAQTAGPTAQKKIEAPEREDAEHKGREQVDEARRKAKAEPKEQEEEVPNVAVGTRLMSISTTHPQTLTNDIGGPRFLRSWYLWLVSLLVAGAVAVTVWYSRSDQAHHSSVKSDVLPYSDNALDEVQLLAMFAAGWPPDDLAAIAEQYGTTFWPGDPTYVQHLRNAGADEVFIKRVSVLKASYRQRQTLKDEILSDLEKGASLARRGQSGAYQMFQNALALDHKNPALQLARNRSDCFPVAQVPGAPPPPPVPCTPSAVSKEWGDNAIMLSADTHGRIYINKDEISRDDLEQRLTDIFKDRAERTVFVRINPKRPFEDVAHLISVANANSIIDRVLPLWQTLTAHDLQ